MAECFVDGLEMFILVLKYIIHKILYIEKKIPLTNVLTIKNFHRICVSLTIMSNQITLSCL